MVWPDNVNLVGDALPERPKLNYLRLFYPTQLSHRIILHEAKIRDFKIAKLHYKSGSPLAALGVLHEYLLIVAVEGSFYYDISSA